MNLSAVGQKSAAVATESTLNAASSLTVHPLAAENENEVLTFLAVRPVHTVFLSGLIRDNGLVSPHNRGTFYGCRNRQGRLEGVALIGHFMLIETRSEAALARFAQLAQDCPAAHMILGEQDKVETFWNYFADDGRKARRVCRQIMFEQQKPVRSIDAVEGLRIAGADDLPSVLPIYARMVYQESGQNPLEEDPVGFYERWLRRVEKNRVWLWTENGRLIFNAGVMFETPEVVYLEGVYVNPSDRSQGVGTRCLSQLVARLLQQANSVCLFANVRNQQAQSFYQRAGFKLAGNYDTIYIHLEN